LTPPSQPHGGTKWWFGKPSPGRLSVGAFLYGQGFATAKLLARDEASRIAANVAKLPELLWRTPSA
jgi:hypothetical protein